MLQFFRWGVCNTLAKYLGLALDPSVRVHGSRHKVNSEVYRMPCPHKRCCSTEGLSARDSLGEPLSGHPQVTPPVSLPPAWQGPGALPAAMAIKGPEMEKMGGGGGGLLLQLEWDLPVCPRRSGLPGSGNGRLDGGEQPGAGSGGWGAPCSPPPPPASLGGTFGPWSGIPGICISSHEGPRGIKLPFHRQLSCGAVGTGGRGALSGLPRRPPTASPQTMATLCWGFMRPAPFPMAQLVTFYHLHIPMGIQRAQMHRETTKHSLPPQLSPSPVPQHPQGSRAGMRRGDAHIGNLPLELFQG